MKFIILFFFSMTLLYSQIHGTVLDSKTDTPLSGVNITGNNMGTSSDDEGKFILHLEQGTELIFSHIGFSKVKANAQNGMTIKMNPLTIQVKEIIVHAGLKDESLQKATSSVTVLNAEAVKRVGGGHFQNIMERVSNLNSAGGTNRPRYFQIRGIGERSHYFAEGPPNFSVGFIMDDIDFSGLGMGGALYDMEQIEVFKGPQSAMYGPNALAGLISLSSKDPIQRFESHIQLTRGSDNIQRLNGMINIPLGKSFSYRFAMESGSGDGFRTNKFLNKTNTNGRSETIVRMKLQFSPNNNFNTMLTYFNAILNNKYDAWAPDNNEDLFTYTNEKGFDCQETDAFSIRTNFYSNKLNASLIVSQSETDLVHAYDGDWGNDEYWLQSPYYFDPNITYWDYEFYDRTDRKRVNQTVEGRLSYGDFIMGYYTKSLTEKDNASGWLYGGDASIGHSTFNFEASAVYGQMEKYISEKINVIVNVRKENNDLKYFGTAQTYDWDENGYISLEPVSFNVNHNLFGGKLALQYFVYDELNVYGSVSRGYKAGGVNQSPALANENRSFDPELMTNYEMGLRYYTNNSTLYISAFTAQRHNQQVSISSQQTVGDPNSFVFYTSNATTGSLSGLELDGTFNLNSALSISGSLGILNTYVEAFTFESDSSVTTNSGARGAAHAPKYSFHLALDYKKEVGIFSRVELSGKDKFYFSDSHDEISKPYQLFNGHLGYDFGKWSVKLWGRNILDVRYEVRGFYFGLEPIWSEELQAHEYPDKKYVSFGDPAHFGLTVEYGF